MELKACKLSGPLETIVLGAGPYRTASTVEKTRFRGGDLTHLCLRTDAIHRL